MTTVSQYHQRTKHRFNRYAKGPETLDWDDQPDPFRRFEGCEIVSLPSPGVDLSVSWRQLDRPRQIQTQALSLDTLGLFLELSFGLSAWKQYGPDRWALRNNPSSGNLHPTEAYLINNVSALMPQGVYHYASYHHHLERRAAFSAAEVNDSLLIGLTSIAWREAWKYGERAYRYCQLDIGHALAAMRYAAAALGWRLQLLTVYNDQEIAALLGVDRVDEFVDGERETPDLLCRIDYKNADEFSTSIAREREILLETLQQADWYGKARSLGAYHMYRWSLIEEVEKAAEKCDHQLIGVSEAGQAVIESASQANVSSIIRQRRSAQHFNQHAEAMPTSNFYRMLSMLMAESNPLLDVWPWRPATHLALFVHNVEGLSPGLYCLPRSQAALLTLRQQFSDQFEWRSVDQFPSLYALHDADLKQIAKALSCHQAIAANGAFSLGMLTEFKDNVEQSDWHYRRLFWECGYLGQILYLEAEALGYRGTGIGCFFDDEVHSLLGFSDDELQSLYHFTVGEALLDSRIQTFPAYGHL